LSCVAINGPVVSLKYAENAQQSQRVDSQHAVRSVAVASAAQKTRVAQPSLRRAADTQKCRTSSLM